MDETPSRKLTVEKEVGYIPGIKIARGVDPINHALFANNSLLLGGASLKIFRSLYSSKFLSNFRSTDQ